MKITVTANFDLGKLDIGEVSKIGLYNSSEAIREKAQELAPYDTGTLKKNIGREPATITKQTRSVRIGPRKTPYAVVREFVNFKNPHRKFYMRRTAQASPEIVREEFNQAIKIVYAKIRK